MCIYLHIHTYTHMCVYTYGYVYKFLIKIGNFKKCTRSGMESMKDSNISKVQAN